ncbi:sel1 repeat family protein [Mariprofundus erugo]|uniref:tetratricopeptide repeat protein n=1 Tax=Mariprofundus erugo TaxID=2528639 RepID=UPI0010FDDBA6|nr:SEL1-like repeat protein [Mariprofundus erugo]TLS78249.1 sel1 repeat family protein [Mariprofundus erugo]
MSGGARFFDALYALAGFLSGLCRRVALLFMALCLGGHAAHAFDLPVCSLYYGKDPVQLDRHAASACREEAKAGDANAQLVMAYACLFGESTRCDEAETLHWFELAAEQGNSEAQDNLAMLLESGYSGHAPDPVLALKWYILSGQQQQVQALIGRMSAADVDDGRRLAREWKPQLHMQLHSGEEEK